MNKIPAIGFAAYSGTGKTTLLEKLVAHLKKEGLRIAVIKHDSHGFQMDKEGKDTWRFGQAGADMTLISSPTQVAVLEYRPRSFEENLTMIHDVDLILVEGYKQEEIPRFGICRKATGKGLPGVPEDYVALVTDDEELIAAAPGPCFGLEDVAEICALVKEIAGL